jgi:hypothetical protein
MKQTRHAVLAMFALGAGLLGCVLSGAATAESDARASKRCYPRGSVGLVRSKEIRVYRTRDGADRLVIACHYGTGRRQVLQSTEEGLYVYPPPAIALRGQLVAYAVEDQTDPAGPILTTVTVENVRTRRSAIGYTPVDPRGPHPQAQVASVALARDASVAWIACDFGAPSKGVRSPECSRAGVEMRVYRRNAGASEPELLEDGTTIDPLSLRLAGRNVKWKSGDAIRSAPLG